jgi:hypothetical protein
MLPMLEWLRKGGTLWRFPLVLGVLALAYLILCAGAIDRRFSGRNKRKPRL